MRSVTWPQFSGVCAASLLALQAAETATEHVATGSWLFVALDVASGFVLSLGTAVLVVRDRERQREDA